MVAVIKIKKGESPSGLELGPSEDFQSVLDVLKRNFSSTLEIQLIKSEEL